MDDDDPTGDAGLTPEERGNWERQNAGEEASIRVYLDAGWYWDDGRLTHPTDKGLNIRIDSLTQDWYPTARLGEVIDAVVRRDGRDGGLFADDKYPTAELSGLMIEEIGPRRGASGDEHGAGRRVVAGRAGHRRRPGLPVLVERAGGAARFAWDEFFYAEHHNPHTQKAYQRAVRRFLAWCEGQGVELPGDHAGHGRPIPRRPGRLAGQAELSTWRRYAASSTGWCNRHVVILNPAASVQGRQGSGDRGQDAGDHHRAGPDAAGVGRYRPCRRPAGPGDPGHAGLYRLPGRGGGQAAAEDFQHDGAQYVLRFQEKGGKSREIPVRHDLEGYHPGLSRGGGHRGRGQGFAAVPGDATAGAKKLTGKPLTTQADLRAGQAAAEGCRAAVAAVAALLPGDGDHRPAERRACRWRTCSTWPGMRSRGRRGFTTGGRRR